MITTYTQTDGAACIRVCNFVLIRSKAVRIGNWILRLDYRDEMEQLQSCPSDCPDLNFVAPLALELRYYWKKVNRA